jgi:hypothetical protein
MRATRPIIHIFYSLTRSPLHSRLDRPLGKAASRRSARIADNLMKDKPMELILIILLLVVLFGGGFGFYRGGYYRQGGPVGIGGILGLILVVLAIAWLVHGHIGGLSL